MKILVSFALFSFVCTGLANPVLSSIESNVVIDHDDITANCPIGYSQPTIANWNYCYKILTNLKNKNSAATQCKSNNGSLASVPNSFINSFLYSLASQNGAASLWLGIECLNGDVNTCGNDDGTPFVFNNFYPGQPNVDGSCIYMSSNGRDSQQWLSFDCGQKFSFACEVPLSGASVIPTSTQKTTQQCPAGYSFFQGMCYVKNFDSNGATREQQSSVCRQISGGNLATIANQEVQEFLHTIGDADCIVRIGLTCPNIKFNGDASSCVWDDGTPFVYNKFGGGYPEVDTPQSSCIMDFNESWLNDDYWICDRRMACSFCQAPPQ